MYVEKPREKDITAKNNSTIDTSLHRVDVILTNC